MEGERENMLRLIRTPKGPLWMKENTVISNSPGIGSTWSGHNMLITPDLGFKGDSLIRRIDASLIHQYFNHCMCVRVCVCVCAACLYVCMLMDSRLTCQHVGTVRDKNKKV